MNETIVNLCYESSSCTFITFYNENYGINLMKGFKIHLVYAPLLRLVANDGSKIEIKLRLLFNAHKFVSTFPTSTHTFCAFSIYIFQFYIFISILLENYPGFFYDPELREPEVQ